MGNAVQVNKSRFSHVPVRSGNALVVTTTNDGLSAVNFAWGTRYTCFFKAKILSFAPGAARLIAGASGTTYIMISVNSIIVSNAGTTATFDANSLILDEWHDYAVVYDGAFARLYRDGSQVSVKALTVNPLSTAQDYNIFNNSAGDRPCNMEVAYFQFYSRAFEPEEVLAHYRSDPNNKVNLEVSYRLQEGTGTTATDTSGNSRNATINGCSWTTFSLPKSEITYEGATSILSLRSTATNRFIVPSVAQKSLGLNGSSSFAAIPIVPSINGFSFGIWVKANSHTNFRTILSCVTATNTDGFELKTTSSLTFQFAANNGASTGTINITTPAFYNKWVFIVGTFIPNNGKLYLNSVLKSTDTSGVMSAPGSFQLGKTLTFGSSCFPGNVKNFTFQNTTTPWTQQQIDDLYYRNIIPSGAKQYSMNDVATDQNGENALTLTGTSYSTDVPPHMKPRTSV